MDTKLSAQFLIHAGVLPHTVGTPLSQLTGHFGIEYAAHDALEDARATARVYVELLKLAGRITLLSPAAPRPPRRRSALRRPPA